MTDAAPSASEAEPSLSSATEKDATNAQTTASATELTTTKKPTTTARLTTSKKTEEASETEKSSKTVWIPPIRQKISQSFRLQRDEKPLSGVAEHAESLGYTPCKRCYG